MVSRCSATTRWTVLAVIAVTLAGCARNVTPSPTARPTSPPTVTATVTASSRPSTIPSPTTTAAPGHSATAPPGAALPAPTNVTLSGRLPNTSATVPPGEGESGRVTVHWDGVSGATGYRIYERSCDGTIRGALDMGRDERQYGPLQPCRPGGDVGVSAVLAGGESAVTWSRGTN